MTVCILFTFSDVTISKYTGSPVIALSLSATTCGYVYAPDESVSSGGKETTGVGSGVRETVGSGVAVGTIVGDGVAGADVAVSVGEGEGVSSDAPPEHAAAIISSNANITAAHTRHPRVMRSDGLLCISKTPFFKNNIFSLYFSVYM
jgi:hypothetical protein